MAALLSQRYKRYVGHDGRIKRDEAFNGMALVVALVAVMMSLVLVYPKESLLKRVFQANIQDSLTQVYVENLIRFDPSNWSLKLIYIKTIEPKLTWSQLFDLTKPILAQGDEQQQKEAIQLLLSKLSRSADSDVDHASQLWPILALALSLSWTAADYQQLIELSLILNNDDITKQLISRLVQQQPDQLTDILKELAATALARGHYFISAQLLFQLRQLDEQVELQREALMQGLAILMAGNLHAQALVALNEQVGALENDVVVLRYLIYVAQASGNPKLAASYAKRLVGLTHEP